MIGFLTGSIRHKEEQNTLLEVGGVGYDIFLGDANNSIGELGHKVELWIYTHVREDQITLFGFKSLLEKKLFLLLTTVSGIGPKLAMAITTQMEPQALLDAVTFGNVKALCRVSGVGRKVADRLILEVKDKLSQVLDMYEIAPAQSPGVANHWQDLGDALSGLGFPETKIRNVVKLARQNYAGQTVDINELLKFALKKIKDC